MQCTPTTAPSDEELASRAQEGCVNSFEQLMRRFQAPVLQFLRHRGTSSDADARDRCRAGAFLGIGEDDDVPRQKETPDLAAGFGA